MAETEITYDRGNILGKGGFAFVFGGTFRCENGERIEVAVKRLQHGDVNANEREVNALQQLKDHPNIIRMYGTQKDLDFR